MARRKSSADRVALDPEEVLAGRVKATAVQLLDLIHRVNPTGRRGDAAGALAALSNEDYEIYGEVQLFARTAEAHLRLTPPRKRERFQKIMALARFVEAHDEKDPEERREMPIPGGTWDRERLDEVAERARAWLDGVGGGEG